MLKEKESSCLFESALFPEVTFVLSHITTDINAKVQDYEGCHDTSLSPKPERTAKVNEIQSFMKTVVRNLDCLSNTEATTE